MARGPIRRKPHGTHMAVKRAGIRILRAELLDANGPVHHAKLSHGSGWDEHTRGRKAIRGGWRNLEKASRSLFYVARGKSFQLPSSRIHT